MARFGQALKPSKVPQQLSKASAPHNPPLALPSYLHIGPSNCFYWASKLLHGTFWPGLLLGSLSTAQPSACFAIVPPHRPYKLFLLGFETATWHVFGQALKPSKVPQQLSKASAPHNPPLALPSYLPISPSNCFYWASKLLHGTCIFVCPTRSPVARRQGCIFSLNLCSMLLGSEATGKRTGNQSLNPEHLYFDIYIYILFFV